MDTTPRANPRFPRLRQAWPALLAALAAAWLLVATAPARAQTPAPAAAPTVPASRQASNVAVITIKEQIDQNTYWSVHRRIELAQRAGADAIVFELNTPGGQVPAVLGICNDIKGCPIKNTVAWVNHEAYSGGAFIALACREIVVADPASLGDAAPIHIDPTGHLIPIPETERQKLLSPIIAELVDSARRNHYDEMLVQGFASLGVELWRVQNKDTGQQLFITRSEYRTIFGEEPSDTTPTLVAAPPLSPTESQPASSSQKSSPAPPETVPGPRPNGGHLVPAPPGEPQPLPPSAPDRFTPAAPGLHGVARDGRTPEQDLPSGRPVLTSADRGHWELKEHVSDGKGLFILKPDQLKSYGLAAATTINTDEELKAFFGARHLLRLDPTWSEGLVAFLTMMPVRGVLIVVFLLALFIEMTHPGLVLPGAISALALVALLAPPMLINLASWWDIAAIVSGILLIALEIFVLPGFGIFGILGLLLLFGGLIGTFVPPGGLFPDTPAQKSDMLYGAVTLALAVATSGTLMYFVSRHFGSLPVLSRLVLKSPEFDDSQPRDEMLAAMGDLSRPVRKGMTGTALTPLRPAGRIELGGGGGAGGEGGGRIIDVVADIGYIPPGARVRVISVSDFRIAVEAIDDPSTSPSLDQPPAPPPPGPGGAAA